MIIHRPNSSRGHADHGWLKAKHTFSFASFLDPNFMGFRSLRVINEDQVAPGKGFGTHGHRDMEILSCVLGGTLTHTDSLGHSAQMNAGDVQYMSAGSGVRHSEYNHDSQEWMHMIQIWIEPHTRGGDPYYQQAHISVAEKKNGWKVIASGKQGQGIFSIKQDALLAATILEPGITRQYSIHPGRAVWLHVVRGDVDVDGARLGAGDAVGLAEKDTVSITARSVESEILLFDLV